VSAHDRPRPGCKEREPVSSILVVEDDPAIRGALVAALEDEGYETEASIDGAAALKRLERVSIDLMLVDVRLPVMTGPEVVAALRQQGSHLPIVMMSAQPERRLPRDVSFLQKPFDLEDLFAVIDDVLSQRDRRDVGSAPC
jgi:CheY-like chemotaxis protein